MNTIAHIRFIIERDRVSVALRPNAPHHIAPYTHTQTKLHQRTRIAYIKFAAVKNKHVIVFLF